LRTIKLIPRISAWLLLAGAILLGLSGWGITHSGFIYKVTLGLIDRGTANAIHLGLQIPVTFILLLHVLTRARISLERRWRIDPWIINVTMIVIGMAVITLVIYIERFA